jgi:hypothetical protein
MPGADDTGCLRRILAEKLNDIPATASGHPQVNDSGVKDVFSSSLDGGTRRLADRSQMAHARQLVPHQLGYRILVVHE